jgi:hypothetical protein
MVAAVPLYFSIIIVDVVDNGYRRYITNKSFGMHEVYNIKRYFYY